MSDHRPPTIDPPAAARWAQRPQTASAWLHEEVARRMEQRLDWIVRQPQRWLHWEPVRGGLQVQALLARRYSRAQAGVSAALPQEKALALRAAARPWWHPARWRAAPAAVPAELLWANMSLHMAADPQALIQRWHKALAVDGFLMFSCFGPDTLRELRALYQSLGWPAPAHEFTDMHDWGDMLVAAGFAEPVMDMERIELTFETPQRLLQELRELGRNLHPARFAGLRGRAWHEQLLAALRGLADPAHDGRLKLTFEVIYGHAFRPPGRIAVGGETRFSVEDLRLSLIKNKNQKAGA
ncbi:MAG: biotin synthase [Burkholderiales bacterium]|nr:biotin synthase [Burkholderiales bacterium]